MSLPTPAEVEALLLRGPYHQWLGLKVLAVGEGSIEIKATWREEWVVNPDRRYTHGGILAALVERGRTGLGQEIEVPMFEVMASFTLGDHLGGMVFDPPLDGGGYARLLSPDRRTRP